MTKIRIEPASAERWDDVAQVMAKPGDASWCWCQFFCTSGKAWSRSTAKQNRDRLRNQVESANAPAPGVLAYLDGKPVGWCAVAPKTSYARLQRSPFAAVTAEELRDRTWVVTCFQVRPEARRQGVARRLLDGAVVFAREHRAEFVEAYPVDAARRHSVSSGDLFHGPLSLFLQAGFHVVARPYPARVVVQQHLI